MKARLCVLLLPALLAGCAGFHSTKAVSVAGPEGAPPPGPEAYLSPQKRDTSDVSDNRRQMLTEGGRTTGFRGGKPQRAWELRRDLDARARQLDATLRNISEETTLCRRGLSCFQPHRGRLERRPLA